MELDWQPYWIVGRLAAALEEFREEHGFRSWVFCTKRQAKRHGYRVSRDQWYACLVHRFESWGAERFFYNTDQLEAAPVHRASAGFGSEGIADFPACRPLAPEDVPAAVEALAREVAPLRAALLGRTRMARA